MSKSNYNLPRTENRPLLLENPQNQCGVQKTTSAVVSLMFWSILIYSLTPAWTWVLSEVGFERIAFTWFFDYIGLEAAAHKIKMVLYWGVMLSMVPVTWAMHNWAVSLEQGSLRKEQNKSFTHDDVAAWAGVNQEDLKRWRSSQRLVVHLNTNARIVDVEASDLNKG